MIKKISHAFSLIELMVVITILILLIGIIVPKLTGSSHKKEIIACAGNLKKLVAAFNMYVLENDGYAPFNPSTSESTGNFWAWETLYMLGEYLGDPQHEKFKAGTWNEVRCPGNRCSYYRNGNDKIHFSKDYDINRQDRHAPETWPAQTIVPNAIVGSSCSPGEQIVDYQYNVSLGGPFNPIDTHDWWKTHKKFYKLDTVVRFPSEVVVFCDIQYALVLAYENESTKYTNQYVYVYPPADKVLRDWGRSPHCLPPNLSYDPVLDPTIPNYIRTNEKIHNGLGINAAFLDGHVEFLTAKEVYNNNLGRYDDLFSWGLSYPITCPKEPIIAKQIPGVHGYRRETNGKKGYWCIEHEFKKGKDQDYMICHSDENSW